LKVTEGLAQRFEKARRFGYRGMWGIPKAGKKAERTSRWLIGRSKQQERRISSDSTLKIVLKQ
jgi:hypothetical protein